MESNTEQKQLEQIIAKLILNGFYEPNSCNFEDEDIKYRYELLKLVSEVKGEKECFQIHNLKNIEPRNCLVQQRLLALLQNIAEYSIEELITRFDSISSFFYSLKKDQKFLDYLKRKKFKAIPFFTMIGFCAFINLGKDISQEIIKLMKKKFMKVIIEKYINEMRKSLFNILLYYNKLVLHAYDNKENNYDFEPNPNDLLYKELKDSLERYMCFNDLFDEGEIVNFVNCLHKAITNDIKSIYLKKGPEIENINEIIKYIFEEILENFSSKSYYQKSNLNNLYDLIAYIIKNLSEASYEENYSKFIIEYCRYHKQGNKNIVISFFSGLNPDNFKETFNNLNVNGNNKDDYYSNIGLYISQLSPKKNKKKVKKDSTIPTKDSNNNQEEKADNKTEDLNNLNNDNSPINNNINNETPNIINLERNDSIKEKKSSEVSNSEKIKNENNEQLKKELEEVKKDMKIMIEKYQNVQEKYQNVQEKYQNVQEKLKETDEKYKLVKEELKEVKKKEIDGQIKIKSELFKLKKEMKQISYRDISRSIINNYIEKYGNKLIKENNLKKKKDKAKKIVTYLKGKESAYYNKIVDKYFDSNYKSHISKIFNDFGKNSIIGLELEKNDIIDKIFSDYCSTILEEKIDNNNTVIEQFFEIKKIINDLYDMQNIN